MDWNGLPVYLNVPSHTYGSHKITSDYVWNMILEDCGLLIYKSRQKKVWRIICEKYGNQTLNWETPHCNNFIVYFHPMRFISLFHQVINFKLSIPVLRGDNFWIGRKMNIMDWPHCDELSGDLNSLQYEIVSNCESPKGPSKRLSIISIIMKLNHMMVQLCCILSVCIHVHTFIFFSIKYKAWWCPGLWSIVRENWRAWLTLLMIRALLTSKLTMSTWEVICRKLWEFSTLIHPHPGIAVIFCWKYFFHFIFHCRKSTRDPAQT